MPSETRRIRDAPAGDPSDITRLLEFLALEEALGSSRRTVERDWKRAKAYLSRALSGAPRTRPAEP